MELSDVVAHNDGDEEEDQQLVSVNLINGFLEYPLHYVAEQKSGYSYGYRCGYSYGYSYGYIYTRHFLNHKELAPNTFARTYR